MAALADQLRNMPEGSFLEMRTEIDGIKLIALAAKYKCKSTCFICAAEGAASTTEEQPYRTKHPDTHRNVQDRAVPRPALAARYFGIINKVDIHDQRRQHELGLEMK